MVDGWYLFKFQKNSGFRSAHITPSWLTNQASKGWMLASRSSRMTITKGNLETWTGRGEEEWADNIRRETYSDDEFPRQILFTLRKLLFWPMEAIRGALYRMIEVITMTIGHSKEWFRKTFAWDERNYPQSSLAIFSVLYFGDGCK